MATRMRDSLQRKEMHTATEARWDNYQGQPPLPLEVARLRLQHSGALVSYVLGQPAAFFSLLMGAPTDISSIF